MTKYEKYQQVSKHIIVPYVMEHCVIYQKSREIVRDLCPVNAIGTTFRDLQLYQLRVYRRKLRRLASLRTSKSRHFVYFVCEFRGSPPNFLWISVGADRMKLPLLVILLVLVGASFAQNTSAPPSTTSTDKIEALDYLLACLTVGVILCVAYGVHRLQSDYISESGAIILFGIAVGGLFELIDWLRHDQDLLLNSLKFDRSVFINVLLPVIIFEAGFSMKHGGVMRNLGAVLLLAIVGTLISTLIIGGIIYGLSYYAAPLIYNANGSLFICFTVGALLSATDPVSVIALLGSKYDLTREPPLLYNLVFGESVLNDAVAIVMFEVFLKYVNEDVTAKSLTFALLNFLEIFTVSTIIGYVIGLICALLFKHLSMEELPHLEVAMCLVFGALSYYLCDFLEMSGIMGLFVTARIIGHHATHNMSFHSRHTTAFVLKTLASLAESAVFLLLGTSVWAYRKSWNAGLCAVVVMACLVSRLFVVFPLCGLSNLARKLEIITMPMQIFMWYSGLRGAIAFGLVVLLSRGEGINPEVSGQMLSATLCVILVTVLLMGSLAAKLLKHLGLDKVPDDEVYESQQSIRASRARRSFTTEGMPSTARGLGRFLRYCEKRFIERFVRREISQPAPFPSGLSTGLHATYGSAAEEDFSVEPLAKQQTGAFTDQQQTSDYLARPAGSHSRNASRNAMSSRRSRFASSAVHVLAAENEEYMAYEYRPVL